MIDFLDVGRLPVAGDNVAIATKRLEAGTTITRGADTFVLSHTILEGHRFAVASIAEGDLLTSWGMAFGKAICAIAPGQYVCNEGVLEALRGRRIDFALPETPNFTDEIPPFNFDAAAVEPAEQIAPAKEQRYFEGFDRGGRGAGTRNVVAVIGVSSRAAGFARRLAMHFREDFGTYKNVDGVVPIAHTEGEDAVQHNRDLVLRTLAGFIVHPNVGAVLLIDHAAAGVQQKDVMAYMAAHDYPHGDVPIKQLSLEAAYASQFDAAVAAVHELLHKANQHRRTQIPAGKLKIALQCGGSDAFSGISGNPLAGWVARAVIAQGGAANLAETDELIGAESYVLKRVKSADVAARFLAVVQRFQDRAAKHGSSAAGNPSGGNKFRGLYNIYLKSLGAAMKREPSVRLDAVIEYGEPMRAPGFYFMDSPGNDLESIAGQVAAGCNMIFFVTGNGSITNFPFVPTLKVVTTSARYELLADDMDVNAGLYLDGMPMDDLGARMLEETLAVASGKPSVGEQAGHAQVQLWRNWRLDDEHTTSALEDSLDIEAYPGIPLPLAAGRSLPIPLAQPRSPDIGLVLPTSLCSGQISQMAAARLNASGSHEQLGIRRFVSLVHTEGCGASSGGSEQLFLRTMCGHLMHPAINRALLMEHGCEKTHNDFFRNYLESENVDTTRYGWASIQQDGGITAVLDRVTTWFAAQRGRPSAGVESPRPRVGLLVAQQMDATQTELFSELVSGIVGDGGAFVIPTTGNRRDDTHRALRTALGISIEAKPTLHYGQPLARNGFHLMASPTWHMQELVAGLGATGVDVILIVSDEFGVPAHPFIPVLQLTGAGVDHGDWQHDPSEHALAALVELLNATMHRDYMPVNEAAQHADLQISRGWRGISL